MFVVVPRNTPIPTKKESTFFLPMDYQTRTVVRVHEGERMMSKDNNFLGEFELSGIPPAPRLEVELVCRFKIDADGILTVTMEVMGSTQKASITIDKESMSVVEIEKMITEAEKMKVEDETYKKRVAAWNSLENFAYKMRKIIRSDKVATSSSFEKTQIEYAIEQVILWLDDNKPATCDDYDEKMKELKAICSPIEHLAD